MVVSVFADTEDIAIGIRLNHTNDTSQDRDYMHYITGAYEVVSERLGEKIQFYNDIVTLHTHKHYYVELEYIDGYENPRAGNYKAIADWLECGVGLFYCELGTVRVNSNYKRITLSILPGLRVRVKTAETCDMYDLSL